MNEIYAAEREEYRSAVSSMGEWDRAVTETVTRSTVGDAEDNYYGEPDAAWIGKRRETSD